jgi:hypothetical protein
VREQGLPLGDDSRLGELAVHADQALLNHLITKRRLSQHAAGGGG